MEYTDKIKNQLISIAQKAYPLECCGLVLKSGEIIESPNLSTSPKYTFKISPQLLYKYSNEIAAVYHSHCTKADVSDEDFKMPTIYDRILINVGIDNPGVKCY